MCCWKFKNKKLRRNRVSVSASFCVAVEKYPWQAPQPNKERCIGLELNSHLLQGVPYPFPEQLMKVIIAELTSIMGCILKGLYVKFTKFDHELYWEIIEQYCGILNSKYWKIRRARVLETCERVVDHASALCLLNCLTLTTVRIRKDLRSYIEVHLPVKHISTSFVKLTNSFFEPKTKLLSFLHSVIPPFVLHKHISSS